MNIGFPGVGFDLHAPCPRTRNGPAAVLGSTAPTPHVAPRPSAHGARDARAPRSQQQTPHSPRSPRPDPATEEGEPMAHATRQQLTISSVSATDVVLGTARHAPDPHAPITSITVTFPSGKVPSDYVVGKTVNIHLDV